MQLTQENYISPDEAEAAFYAAFSHCDKKAMGEVWAEDDVVCIHPGSNVIVGYDAVMRSWTNIFSNAGLPGIAVNVIKRIHDVTLAVHLVEEVIATGENAYVSVLATNVYRKYEHGWFMVGHHSAVVQAATESHTLQ